LILLDEPTFTISHQINSITDFKKKSMFIKKKKQPISIKIPILPQKM